MVTPRRSTCTHCVRASGNCRRSCSRAVAWTNPKRAGSKHCLMPNDTGDANGERGIEAASCLPLLAARRRPRAGAACSSLLLLAATSRRLLPPATSTSTQPPARSAGSRPLPLTLQHAEDPRLQRRRNVDLAKLRTHAAQHARLEVEFPRTPRADLEVLVHQRRLLGGKLTIEVVIEAAKSLLARIAVERRHRSSSRCVNSLTIPDSSARHHKAFCSILRPRCRRERTVPTGTSSTSAISW